MCFSLINSMGRFASFCSLSPQCFFFSLGEILHNFTDAKQTLLIIQINLPFLP